METGWNNMETQHSNIAFLICNGFVPMCCQGFFSGSNKDEMTRHLVPDECFLAVFCE